MGKYEDTIVCVFENKIEDGYDTDEEIPFDRDDIETALDELGLTVKNVPDIPYAYRSRRSLPEHIERHGYNTIILDNSIEGTDVTYLFTKREQLIHVPDEYDEVHRTSLAELPEPVREYIGKDEQGVLTQVRYAKLLDDFMEMETYHLQSHMRFRVNSREAGLDDLYIGVDPDGNDHAIAVEAKGVGETLNKNQLIRNTRGIEQKANYPNRVETVAVKLDEDGYFYVFEFNVHQVDGEDRLDTERVWQYEFSEETTE